MIGSKNHLVTSNLLCHLSQNHTGILGGITKKTRDGLTLSVADEVLLLFVITADTPNLTRKEKVFNWLGPARDHCSQGLCSPSDSMTSRVHGHREIYSTQPWEEHWSLDGLDDRWLADVSVAAMSSWILTAGNHRKRRKCPRLYVLVPDGLPWVYPSTQAHRRQEHKGQNACH